MKKLNEEKITIENMVNVRREDIFKNGKNEIMRTDDELKRIKDHANIETQRLDSQINAL
jgi:hypothetical protein